MSVASELAKILGVDETSETALREAFFSSGLSGARQLKRLPIVALTTGVKDTGFDLPTKGLVYGCYLEVTTLEATASTKTIDVGLLASESGGDADGFLDGADTSAAGVVRGSIVVTDGSNQNFIAASPTLGALLRTGELGGDAAGTSAALIPTPHVLNGVAKSVIYTLGSEHTELAGFIWLEYLDLTRWDG